mmetsp:Transcript_15052/g.23282  ORF Transcript_15052/g.23282 Transcript_15052/m.23282 type:complete len:213 (-) Transcript_15052:98-736(-)
MAKTKYFEKGICSTVAESCERLISEYIVPNTSEQMEWQEFRDNKLWCLEIDDIFKANSRGLERLYKAFATNGVGKNRYFQKDDALKMMEAAGIGLSEKKVSVAYALSKATIANEMGDFDKYNQMNMSEFYEFLSRAAELFFVETQPLTKKVEKFLMRLLPVAEMEYIYPNFEEDLESESDCDDDWVDECVQKNLKERENESGYYESLPSETQ